VRVETAREADIVVRGASMGLPSNESLYGRSTDGDAALEYFENQTIRVDSDLDPERLGWHVGFWVGDSVLAASGPEDLPPAFDDPETDPRKAWWVG
jgi:hypothetical protein